jgi:Uma2 family endonuclease
MRIYGRERVPHLWIVDPILRTVEVYRLEGERWIVATTHGGGDPARLEPFATVDLEVARWWLDPAPSAPPA